MIKNLNVKKTNIFHILLKYRNYFELSEKNVIRAKLIITLWTNVYMFSLENMQMLMKKINKEKILKQCFYTWYLECFNIFLNINF